MNRSINQLGRIAVFVMLCAGAAGARADRDPTVVAFGKLDGKFLAASLFHIDEFWMKVADGTEFNRWLSQGLDHEVVVRLAAGAATSGDEPNARVLSGTLSHQMAPKPTSIDSDVVGRLPRGDSGFVHEYFVSDAIAGAVTLSPVTFETADSATVAKFSPFEGGRVTIVIEIH